MLQEVTFGINVRIHFSKNIVSLEKYYAAIKIDEG